MDTSQLTASVTAFKAQTQEAAITPTSLGTLLQAIVDSLEQSALATDTTALQQWQTNVKGIGSVLMSAQVQSNTTTSLVLGFYEASLTSGIPKLSARTVSLPTATAQRAGVMTAAQAELLANCQQWYTLEQDRYAQTEAKIPNKAAYTAAERRIDVSHDGTVLFSLTLPLATSSVPGLTTTADVTSLRTNLATQQKLVRELGNFASEEAALEYIGKPAICGDTSFAVVHCTYQTEMSLLLVQNIVNDYCRQVIFNKERIFQRAIYFTSSARSTISYMEDWAPLFCDRLQWDADNHKYLPSLFGLTFNKDYTDPIPLATTSQAGLMTAAQVQQMNRIENKLDALLGTNA